MKRPRNKRYIISLFVTVLGLIALISGTSYAILKGSAQSVNEQVITAGSVELKLTENFDSIDNGVSIMKDADGLLQETVYEFSVTNIGSVAAKYDLKLLNEAPSGQTALDDQYIRVGLEVNGQEMGPMGLSKVNSIIDSNTISENEVIRYKLRVWLDNSKESEIQSNSTKKAYLSLKIEAKQSEYTEYKPEPGATVLYSDGTLIINEPTSKRTANTTKHGAVSKEYTEMNDENSYVFTAASQRPWNSDVTLITKVEIGQRILPTSMAYWFRGLTNMESGDFTNLDVSNVTSMYQTFYQAGYNASSFKLTGLDKWNTSNVTTMQSLFEDSGYNATIWSIGDLSNWDTSKVTNMKYMFLQAGYNATTWHSIGTLKVYASNVDGMFSSCTKAKITIDIYSNPQSGENGYDNAFYQAATDSGALITVNYSSATTNIDSIIATKSSDSNVVKGNQLD